MYRTRWKSSLVRKGLEIRHLPGGPPPPLFSFSQIVASSGFKVKGDIIFSPILSMVGDAFRNSLTLTLVSICSLATSSLLILGLPSTAFFSPSTFPENETLIYSGIIIAPEVDLVFNSLPPTKFFPAFCRLLIFFFKIHFFRKNSFRNTIRVSNTLDPDQALTFCRA